ncbi:hypothetical protein QN379_21815, partial [Glaciimonas sp. Gout2]
MSAHFTFPVKRNNRILWLKYIKPLLSAVLFTLIYTPLLGAFNSTVASAQPGPSTTTYAYDKVGNRTQVTDPLGRITTYQYDSLNRPIQQRLPSAVLNGVGPTIHLQYDPLDYLRSVTDPRDLVTHYTVDGFGNPTATASPDTGNTTRTFNAAGKLKTATDARGKTSTYAYDVLGRLTRIGYASGPATAFTYDGASGGQPAATGYLTGMVDSSGESVYTYDGFGQLLHQQHTIVGGPTIHTLSVKYVFGENGSSTAKPILMRYPSGNSLLYAHDAAGRLNSIRLQPAHANGGNATEIALVSAIGNQPFGPVNGWTWGNSTETDKNTVTRTFDLDGRMTSYPLGSAHNGNVRRLTYDAASRIIAIHHSGTGKDKTGKTGKTPADLDQRYKYDNLDRLISVSGVTEASATTNTQRYQYDQSGNRIRTVLDGRPYGNSIATNSNRLTSTTGPAPARTNMYDASGHLTSDGMRHYTYDDRGRMHSATNGGNTVIYTYNGIGQRVQKQGPNTVVATGINRYVYDAAGHLLGEYDAAWNPIQETVYLGDIPIAILKPRIITNGGEPTTVTDIFYIYADHSNTPRVITDASNNQMVWRWDQGDPFG